MLDVEMAYHYTIVETPFGWMGLLGSAQGLRRTVLPDTSLEAARAALLEGHEAAAEDSSFFGELPDLLRRYFSGDVVDLAVTLDLAGGTAFQQAVWEAARAIPYGQTRSYGWVAATAGRPGAARAAGRAMGCNPVPPFVPCHRVVAASGLGGFSSGLDLKRRLLALEGNRSSP